LPLSNFIDRWQLQDESHETTQKVRQPTAARKVPVFAQDSRGEVDVVGKILNFKDP
jgi:hypothetical protein